MERKQQPSPEGQRDERIAIWLKIGLDNLWIRQAWDPPFGRESFSKCERAEELAERLRQGNWCLGQAFYYEDLCFINQVDGGDEWLTIRHSVAFESITFGAVERQQGRDAVIQLLTRLLRASLEECKDLAH